MLVGLSEGLAPEGAKSLAEFYKATDISLAAGRKGAR